jgi:TRAP-type mannitol/chloroaromatic compound transport system permease large subunit
MSRTRTGRSRITSRIFGMSACRRSQPDIPLRDVIWGVLPFVALMIFAVVLMCVFPGIATWFPDAVMGGKTR